MVSGSSTAQQPTYATVHGSPGTKSIKVSGELFTAHPGKSMTVTLSRLLNGTFKQISTKQAQLGSYGTYGTYATSFDTPDTKKCKVVAKFPGDSDHRPSKRTTTFAC